ncbi:hypothetical protein ABPG72_003979 [Tetrahymena utriculariae]
MLKEKFKEVGRLNNEIYQEDLLNIKDTILGISGSYFTKKIFENIYQYQDHSIGMSKKMLDQKVIKFKNLIEKFNIQIIIVFENLLSVRLNQRNSILKKTLVQHNVQFINTPYSEHAQLIYYFKNNLISGIVSDLDIIKYFSETNNYVIIDFILDSEQFEWIHLSKFLASMNLTHHYARQLLLQEQSQRKIQKDVIEQFDNIQKQKNFDRDSSVNHPSYKDQIFRIEYVPIINISCNLQFYKQTIETPSMEDRMKKHFGILLPPTLYQFFAFDLISSDIFNIFGYQRFKYVPNIYDSKELKILITQTCQHYSKVISLIKQYLPETNSKSEIFNIISENEEYTKEKEQQQHIQQYPPSFAQHQSTQPIQNYEYVYSDIINELTFQHAISSASSSPRATQQKKGQFNNLNDSQNHLRQQQFSSFQVFQSDMSQVNNDKKQQFQYQQYQHQQQNKQYQNQIQQLSNNQNINSSNKNINNSSFGYQKNQINSLSEVNVQNEYQLIRILQKYLDVVRKNSKNPSRKNSENIKAQQQGGPDKKNNKMRNKMQSQIGDKQEDIYSNGLDCQKLNRLLQNQPNQMNSDEKNSSYQLSDYEETVRNTASKSLGQNPLFQNRQISALQIFSLAALNFFNLQELIILSKQQITLQAKYLSKCSVEFSEQLIIFANIIQNQNLCNIFFSNLFFDPEEPYQKEQSLKDQGSKDQIPKDQQQNLESSSNNNNNVINDQNSELNQNSKESSSSQKPQCTTMPPLPPSANYQNLQAQASQSILKTAQTNPKDLFQKKLIDEQLPVEVKTYILVVSRIFSLSELSFKEWKNEDCYDFELTQYIKIIQSFQSILRNQFDCLMLCSYCYINNNHNIQSVLESKKYLPFRKNYNCGMGMLIILLLQNKLKIEDVLKDEENFPYIQQEMMQAFLLWDNIFGFIKQQQTDKYVDPSIVNMYGILNPSNEYLYKKIDRKIVFCEKNNQNSFNQQNNKQK